MKSFKLNLLAFTISLGVSGFILDYNKTANINIIVAGGNQMYASNLYAPQNQPLPAQPQPEPQPKVCFFYTFNIYFAK